MRVVIGCLSNSLPPHVLKMTGLAIQGALALERSSVVHNGALHWEAAEGTNREGHRSLARGRIVGGKRTRVQGSRLGSRFGSFRGLPSLFDQLDIHFAYTLLDV